MLLSYAIKLISRALPNCFVLVLFFNLWSAGGELFTGLYSDYWGRDAALFRTMNRMAHLRTEPDSERLLKGMERRNNMEPEVFQMTREFLFSQKLKCYCSCIGISIWR